MDDEIALKIINIRGSLDNRNTQEEIIRLAGYSNLNSTGGRRVPLAHCPDKQIASAARDYVARAKTYIDGLKAELHEAVLEDSHIPIEVEHANRMYEQFNVPVDQRDIIHVSDLEDIIQYH